MGKRTSDFWAIAMIAGGAGIGLAVTSLGAADGPDTFRNRDDSQVRVQVRHRIRVEPGDISVRTSRRNAPNVYMWRRMGEEGSERVWTRRMSADMEMRRGELEDLRVQIGELGDSEALIELLDGVESLELDLGEWRVEVQHEGDDQRKRRRRRRRPRRMADVPNGAGSGN